MAKDTSKKKADSGKGKMFSFLKDERFLYITGILLLFASAYLLLAFVSYLFTWKTDQSRLNLPLGDFLNTEIVLENWTGKTGALIANNFLHNWFGLSSFVFIYLMVIIGLRMLGIRIASIRKSVKFSIVTIVWLSVALSFIFGDSMFSLGGTHGFLATTWLNATLGKVGTAFLLFLFLIVFILLTFEGAIGLAKKIFSSIFDLFKIRKVEKDNEFSDEILDDENSENPEKVEDDTNDLEVNLGLLDEDKITDEQEDQTDLNRDVDEINKETITDIEENNTNEIVLEAIRSVDENEVSLEDGDIELTVEDTTKEEDWAGEVKHEETKDYDPTQDLSHYKFPPLELLVDHSVDEEKLSDEEWQKALNENKNRIVETLGHYKIEISKISATIGPTITLYEIVPAPGIRISKIKNLEDDIALSLAALGIRIIAPMPGKGTIGIEVPNPKPEVVSMRSIIGSKAFQETKFDLPIALGKTITNETYVVDLTKMPHMLVAGATGQGKSVGINAILTSLLYKKHPSQLKFVLVDPKKVELSIYTEIENHFLARLPDEEESIITDTNKVVNTLNSLCIEMDQRYDLLKEAGARNIKEYNQKYIHRRLNPEKGHRYLPYIVVIIDEFADLIMTAGKNVETPIARLAQLARAIGIHLIIATQRPSTNIITGVIKANFPTRVAFKVSSMIDSRTILDSPGANQLIGRGDMLINKGSDLVRVQCAFVDTPEVEEIVEHISKQQSYGSPLLLPEYHEEGDGDRPDVDLNKRDPLFDDAARLIISTGQGSTSLIQRKFSIGYNRAGKLIDQLEAAGIVGSFQGSKAREVHITDMMALEQLLRDLNNQ